MMILYFCDSLLKVHLQLRGFSVFIDVEKLEAGKFDNNLLKSVRHAQNFVLVLSSGSLDRCFGDSDRKDWVHRVRTIQLHAACHSNPFSYMYMYWLLISSCTHFCKLPVCRHVCANVPSWWKFWCRKTFTSEYVTYVFTFYQWRFLQKIQSNYAHWLIDHSILVIFILSHTGRL